MADLNAMKAAASAQGAQAPADYPGGPDKWVEDWYANAVAAGSVRDPSRTVTTESGTNRDTGAREGGIEVSRFDDAAGSDEWKGKRAPTVQEMRKWGAEQHAGYVGGDQTKQDEDWARFSDAQLAAWINEGWDASKGDWKSGKGPHGDADCPAGTTFHGSKCVSWDKLPYELGGTGTSGPAGGNGARGGPPPPPTTFGSNLSYTGNPLTDMLLYQFNTGSQLSDPSKMNAFAMGEDKQEGGEGANADAGKRTGQLLKGGGLWWQGEQDAGNDAFGGFRADTVNASPTAAAPAPAPAPAASTAPTPAQIAAPPPATPAVAQPATVSGMLQDNFSPRKRKRDENGEWNLGGYQGQEREAQVF